MTTLTLGTIEDICGAAPGQKSALDVLLTLDPKPPAVVGYWMSKNARHLRSEFKHLMEQKRELIISLGAEAAENNMLSLPKDDKEAAAKWNEETAKLRDVEVEVDIHVFAVDKLGDYNPGPALFSVFDFMFTAEPA